MRLFGTSGVSGLIGHTCREGSILLTVSIRSPDPSKSQVVVESGVQSEVKLTIVATHLVLFVLGRVSREPSGGLSESFLALVFLPSLFGSFFVYFTRRFHCASSSLVIFGRFCHIQLSQKGSRIYYSRCFSNCTTNQCEQMRLGIRQAMGQWRAAAYPDRLVVFPICP